MRKPLIMATLSIALAASAAAQTSASYKLSETAINDGGNPTATTLASAHFHVKLDAIGDGVVGSGLTSASFHADTGFVGRYRPPGEVTSLTWSGKTTLQWNPERSIGKYEVYRDLLTALPGGAFGGCLASELTAESATDASTPVTGQGWFYLVTARNRLREEGPKGYRSGGIEEANPSPCP
ncbi:MAG TPA: hypothetical protein VFV19_17945 [Candidatus Polarisedimenticolaceae bacterium]|nr:hypothetical protein [Candidatus Polarisedimenticolaceae bacterium]